MEPGTMNVTGPEPRFRFHQTRFVPNPEAPAGLQGDCWATAVAIVLNQSPEERDELHELICATRGNGGWYNVTIGWTLLATKGRHSLWSTSTLDETEGVFLVASGKSPRGDFDHSVVWSRVDNRMVWDPHPSGDGLAEEPIEFAFLKEMLMEVPNDSP